ncbi:hypothetical protein M0813_15016 [Anaeramoeba flamelloides]|uniref:Uncharacterized protein n=1 Tax=Anaeramoeba flamelloides TaxID=1746091 RepID=A0ABQ8X6S8_9EUKA|nr:hypothetical protein M0813_09046 [Anaeramoeba flamelloides]KAJ6251476.1 hypothetical protein M0813_15016 [Anaeramoeba flamelloides]
MDAGSVNVNLIQLTNSKYFFHTKNVNWPTNKSTHKMTKRTIPKQPTSSRTQAKISTMNKHIVSPKKKQSNSKSNSQKFQDSSA